MHAAYICNRCWQKYVVGTIHAHNAECKDAAQAHFMHDEPLCSMLCLTSCMALDLDASDDEFRSAFDCRLAATLVFPSRDRVFKVSSVSSMHCMLCSIRAALSESHLQLPVCGQLPSSAS